MRCAHNITAQIDSSKITYLHAPYIAYRFVLLLRFPATSFTLGTASCQQGRFEVAIQLCLNLSDVWSAWRSGSTGKGRREGEGEERRGQGRTEEEKGDKDKDKSRPMELRCQISCLDHTLEDYVFLSLIIKFARDMSCGVGMAVYLVHSLSQRLKLDISVDDPHARTRTQSK